MPIFVQFLFEKKVMDHESLRKWLRQGRCTYPPPLIENNILDKYLLRVTKTYGFLQQPEFIHDLAEFSTQLDLGLNQRESLRLARFILSFAGGRVDYTGNPEDDFYLHPIDLPLLNREGRGMIMEHLSAGEMFDICDVLIVSETHTCHSASKYLHISHAYLAGEQKYEIRVMLDGLGRRANNHKLDKWTINRNYPFIDNTLYQNYQFYGLEPEESQMFTSCEKIHSLDKTQKHKIASWLYFNVREDEEFKKAVKSMGLHIYNKLMDDANEFASKKELTFEMEQVIRQVGKNIEFQNQSAIRMDVNFAWGHTIEEVLNKPPTGNLKVKVLVLCGTNHLLSRSIGNVPLQATIRHACVRAIVISNTQDISTTLEYRQISESSNYVYTIPEFFVNLSHYFAEPPKLQIFDF